MSDSWHKLIQVIAETDACYSGVSDVLNISGLGDLGNPSKLTIKFFGLYISSRTADKHTNVERIASKIEASNPF